MWGEGSAGGGGGRARKDLAVRGGRVGKDRARKDRAGGGAGEEGPGGGAGGEGPMGALCIGFTLVHLDFSTL
jgi:hypothetical protein